MVTRPDSEKQTETPLDTEELIRALREEEVDAVVGARNVLLLRLKKDEDQLKKQRDYLQQVVQERGKLLHELEARQARLEAQDQELRRRTQELELANRELEQFAYVASHDLREPLRMIVSFSQLLQKKYQDKLDKDANEFMGFIVDGAKRMQNLIDDLLRYSRVGTRARPFEPTDMEKVLQEVLMGLRMAIQENRAEVTHDPLPVVQADSTQMYQVLENLIGNGIKFHREETPHVHVSARPGEGETLFSVSDNGIGIDTQFYDQLFVLFQRLNNRDKYPGTGIGLAVAKKIVQRHGGRIWVESQPGRGSTFFFTVPVVAATAAGPEGNR